MRPYVLRVKLRGTDIDFGFRPEQVVPYTKSIGEMRRILVKNGRISAIAAQYVFHLCRMIDSDSDLIEDIGDRSSRHLDAHWT
jgi:hypothetical protein